MSKLEVDAIEPQSGTTLTLGASGDSVTLGSGASLTSPGLTLSDNILFNAASKGIYLGVTTATASNLLDDYEEGTWTPVIRGGTTAGTYTFINSTARYIKIGKKVTVMFACYNITQSSAGTGDLQIADLPFAASTDAAVRYVGTVGLDTFSYNSGSFAIVAISSGNSYVRVWENTASAADSVVQVTDISSGTSDLYFTITYFTS